MTPWEMRLDLAIRGWSTNVRLNQNGISAKSDMECSFGIWAKRWHWAGGIAEICIHDHRVLDLRDDIAFEKMADVISAVHTACIEAARDFRATVPEQMHPKVNGKIVLKQSELATQNLNRDKDLHPTEDLLSTASCYAGRNEHLIVLATQAIHGMNVSDAINPYFGRSRYASDCKDRNWGYKLDVGQRRSGGVKVLPTRHTFSTQVLDEDVVSGVISQAGDSIRTHYASYAPGGARDGQTPNGMPPGVMTLSEYSARLRAKEAQDAPEGP